MEEALTTVWDAQLNKMQLNLIAQFLSNAEKAYSIKMGNFMLALLGVN